MTGAFAPHNEELVIHIWPAKWNLASLDVQCLAAIFYLQFTFPGQFVIQEEVNPDASPSGQLPYLTHGYHSVSPLPSIISYLSSLYAVKSSKQPEDEILPLLPDSTLTPLQKQQSIAWRAYVDSQVGDLVAHSLFSLYPNYAQFTHPTFTSLLPLPQRLYLPNRIRDSWKSRLEAAMLWENASTQEEDETEVKTTATGLKIKSLKENKAKLNEEELKRAFGKERTLERARTVFDLLTKLIPNDSFIYGGTTPSILDLTLSSYFLFLLHAPLPNPLLKTLLLESYPQLISHACLVHARAFPSSSNPSLSMPPPKVRPVQSPSLTEIGSYLVQGARRVLSPYSTFALGGASKGLEEMTEEQKARETQMRRGRWAWFALAGVSLAAYAWSLGLRIVISTAEEEEGPGEEWVEVGEGGQSEGAPGEEEAVDEGN